MVSSPLEIGMLRVAAVSFAMVLAVSAQQTVIDVTTHGAVPDDGGLDTVAIAAAIGALNASTQANPVLYFPSGTYNVENSSLSPLPPITKSGCQVRAGGVTLRWDGYDRTADPSVDIVPLLRFDGALGVTVTGLSIDMSTPAFVQGVVAQAVAGQYLDIEIREDAMRMTPSERVVSWWKVRSETCPDLTAVMWDEHLNGGSQAGVTILQSPSAQDPSQVVRITPTGASNQAISRLAVGDTVVVRHRAYTGDALRFDDCSGVVLRDVEVRACAGTGLYFNRCLGTIDLERVAIAPRKGWLLSSMSDGIKIAEFRGASVSLRDCSLINTGDDGMNVHGKWAQIQSVGNGVSLDVLRYNSFFGARFLAGDRVEVRTPQLLKHGSGAFATLGTSTANWQAGVLEGYTIDIASLSSVTPDFATSMLLPTVAVAPGPVFNRSCLPELLHVQSTRFRGNRGRGLVTRAPNSEVVGCDFRGMTGPGLLAATGNHVGHVWEAGLVDDLLVEDCVFENACSRGGKWTEFAALQVEASYVASVWATSTRPVYCPQGALGRVVVRDTVIRDCALGGLFCSSASAPDGLLVEGVLFKNVGTDVVGYNGMKAGAPVPPEYSYGVFTVNAHRSISGCRFVNCPFDFN